MGSKSMSKQGVYVSAVASVLLAAVISFAGPGSAWAQADDESGDEAPAEGDGADPAAGQPTADAPEEDVAEAEVPMNLRLRQLENNVHALKERAWLAKARLGMLKEMVLQEGVASTTSIVHKNKMGNDFRLIKLVYALDGTPIFSNQDGQEMHKLDEIEILNSPVAPGSHTLTVLAVYQGHGRGIFSYLSGYRFSARASHTFTVKRGESTRLVAVGYERGGWTTPLEERPAIKFQNNPDRRQWEARETVARLKAAAEAEGGSKIIIKHRSDMGNSFRLTNLSVSMDGTEIFVKSGTLHRSELFQVLDSVVKPGKHNLSVNVTYRGHGYGPFKWMRKVKYKVRGGTEFTADKGKSITIEILGYEKGGVGTPMEERPKLGFTVK